MWSGRERLRSSKSLKKQENEMRLTAIFELSAKSKQELHGLHRTVFNKLANPKLPKSQRQIAMALLANINAELGRRF